MRPVTRPVVAGLLAGLLAITACGGSGGDTAAGPTGEPVSGGTGRILITGDPRGLDPALLSNESSFTASVGNALYGQLLTNNPSTREITYAMAEDLVTSDAGASFTLTLKPGLVFSDGTPLTAEDVKYNWEHIADPSVASNYGGNAREISGMQVQDDRTVTITLRNPNAQFAVEIYETALNWIGKPETLQAGPEESNARPVGAGPFTLQEWRRQDVIALARNDNYYDKPRPYLDRLEIRPVRDEEQRLNTVAAGGADVAQETQFPALARAEQQSMQIVRTPVAGGLVINMNTRKAPFDDIRARKALSYALDRQLIDDAVNGGTGSIPTTLFPQDSPYHRNIPLHQHDPVQARALLEELAAEGKPLTFELSIYATPGQQRLAQSLQTQLSTLPVTMTTRVIDVAQQGKILQERDFQSMIASVTGTSLWIRLRGGANNNYSGIDDPALNRALDDSRRATDQAQISADYEEVQKRLQEATPVIFYGGIGQAAYSSPQVGGLTLYGNGSLLVDRLWIQP